MKALPTFVQDKLQPRLKVIWWGRRAVYEVIEEVSNAAFWQYIVFGTGLNVARYIFEWNVGWMFWFSLAIIMLMASQRAIIEILNWQNEIYIVARDEVNGGGRIYKFFGWLSKRYIDEAITIQSPTILPEQPWYWRLWGWVTGEQMMKVKLASVNHVYMEGKKISPQFERAIKFIRGYKPGKEETPATDLSKIADLHLARLNGGLTQAEYRDFTLALARKVIYGE